MWRSSSEGLRSPCPVQPKQTQLRDGNTSEIPSTMLLHWPLVKNKQRQQICLRPTWTRYSLSLVKNGKNSYKSSPSERTLHMLRVARNKVQQISRHCANDFWLQLCNHIQVFADTGNLNGIYDGTKQTIEPVHVWAASWNLPLVLSLRTSPNKWNTG